MQASLLRPPCQDTGRLLLRGLQAVRRERRRGDPSPDTALRPAVLVAGHDLHEVVRAWFQHAGHAGGDVDRHASVCGVIVEHHHTAVAHLEVGPSTAGVDVLPAGREVGDHVGHQAGAVQRQLHPQPVGALLLCRQVGPQRELGRQNGLQAELDLERAVGWQGFCESRSGGALGEGSVPSTRQQRQAEARRGARREECGPWRSKLTASSLAVSLAGSTTTS
mmetsp:Transcript_34688/g.98293  ORF Transcript_34688/g.98293 Transcript_34688/m.98293 type:complete len:221 (-) Transcript_34688:538-1200(-)